MVSKSIGRWLAGTAALVCVSFSAQAQTVSGTTGTPDATAPADKEALGGVIVVTARKRTENLRDVPVSIAALSGNALVEKNITQVLDLAAITPSFQFSNGALSPFLYVRGFGSGSQSSFEQSVGTFVDNVSRGRDQDGRLPLFDIAQVEILKGPQVVTFGNSATAGALNVSTRKPGSNFEADGSIGYEFNNHEVLAQGGVTVPLSSWASFRLGGLYQDIDKGSLYNPTLDRTEPKRENWGIRPSLLLHGSDISLLLRYEHARTYEDGNAVQIIGQPLSPAFPPFSEASNPDIRVVDVNSPPYSSEEFAGVVADAYQADINYDALGGTLTSTTAYRKAYAGAQFGADGFTPDAPFYFNGFYHRYNQFSQELRFNGTFGEVDAQVGAYYQHDRYNMEGLQAFVLTNYGLPFPPFSAFVFYDQRQRTYSGFADITWHVSDRWSVSAGLRYSNHTKDAGQGRDAGPLIPNLPFRQEDGFLRSFVDPAYRPLLVGVLGTTPHDFPFGSLHFTEDHWQPQAIVQYEFGDGMVYAKYVKGAKVGGFDFFYASDIPEGARFQPELAESFEAGVKGSVPSTSLDYSLTAFRTTFTNLQQNVYENLRFVVSNVGEARSQGIEAELNYHLAEDLKLGLQAVYLDAKFVDFPNAPCNSGQILATPSGCTQDLSGAPTQYASKWTGGLTLDYRKPIMNGGYMINAGASVFARAKFNVGSVNDPRMVQHGFALVDAHIDLAPDHGWWNLSLFGRNLTNKKYLEYGVLFPAVSTAWSGTYARGRQIGLRFGFNFR